MKKILMGLGVLQLSISLFSAQSIISYFGNTRSTLVVVQLNGSTAFVEYCFTNYMGLNNIRFDTLEYKKNKYAGRFSKIRIFQNELIFNPGNIKLKPGEPVGYLNKWRNQAYLKYADTKYKKALKWTGEKLDDFSPANWNKANILQLKSEAYRKIIWNTYDSLYQYYTSAAYTHKFDKVTIENCRIIPKTYFVSTDTSEIQKIWRLLSKASPKQKNIVPYLVQIPIPLFLIGNLTNDILIFALPIIYPIACLTLICSEKLIAGRISAGTTYKTTFMSNQDTKIKCVIRIRNSKIIRDDFTYYLPFNFEKTIINSTKN